MLKASVEILRSAKKESFLIKQFDRKGFDAPFHFHPEIELTCITEGKGTRFVGSNMTGFESTDIVLIGSNLPHCWRLPPSKDCKAASIVIQFSYHSLGNDFFGLPEMSHIQKLLQRSECGIEFQGKIKERVKERMTLILKEKNHFKRLLLILELLNQLSLSREYVLLNKENPVVLQPGDNRERINTVFSHILANFQHPILLKEVSAMIGMTPNAFCKFFKRITRKTFVETVTDYRISFATQQLVDTDKSISDVCFESGFCDMSHFYKTFSSRMKTSPLHYRKQFLKETENEE